MEDHFSQAGTGVLALKTDFTAPPSCAALSLLYDSADVLIVLHTLLFLHRVTLHTNSHRLHQLSMKERSDSANYNGEYLYVFSLCLIHYYRGTGLPRWP